MSAHRFLIIALISLVALFAGVNLFAAASLSGARLDLTERGLYRLSPGAKDVIARLEEPVTLTLYFSRARAADYPVLRAYGSRVREMLRSLSAEGGARVRFEEVDPAAFSPEEDEALAAGLEPLPVDGGAQVLFGLIGRNAVDERRAIALFDPADEARLEYDLIRLIAELERAQPRRLAVITSLALQPDLEGGARNRIAAELGRDYELIWVEGDFTALPEADALALLHPPPLNEGQLYAVDQFALETGRVFAALVPLAHIALKPGPDGLPPLRANRSSDLAGLLTAWGALYDPAVAVMDRETALPVQIVEDGRSVMRAYPLWFAVPESGLSSEHPATTALNLGVNLGAPGALAPLEGAPTRFEPLIQTTASGARVDADIAAGSPGPDELLEDYAAADDAPLTLAARVSGPIETAFPDGPPAETGRFDPRAHRSASAGPVEIVLIADADWLDEPYFIRPSARGPAEVVADNAAFALNVLDALTGDPALVSLRSASASARPMTRLVALRTQAEARYETLQGELEARLQAAEAQLEALTEAGAASALGGAGEAQAAEAAALREDILATRAQLREVARGLREDVEALEETLLFWTVWAPPGLVLAFGAAVALIRRIGERGGRKAAHP